MPKNGVHRVGLHAHPDDDESGARRRPPQHVVDDPGHADGLEHHRRALHGRRTANAARPGSTASCAPIVCGQFAPSRRKVRGHDGFHAPVAQRGDDRRGRPARSRAPAPPRPAAIAGLVDRVQADRHRLGQGGVTRIEAVRHRQQQRRRQQHPLGVAADRGVAVDDRFDAGRRQQHRDRRDDRARLAARRCPGRPPAPRR